MATWLERIPGWTRFHHACDSRRGPQHITTLLREGADPALPSPAGETPLQISALTDPGRGALPENKAMTKLLEQALKPWHQKRHRLFPRTFTPRVVVVLLLQQRLERYAALWAEQSLGAGLQEAPMPPGAPGTGSQGGRGPGPSAGPYLGPRPSCMMLTVARWLPLHDACCGAMLSVI